MNFCYVMHFTVLIVLFSVLPHFSIEQECDPNVVKCGAEVSEGKILSCKDGDLCADTLKKCKSKMDCASANTCIGAGIFPDMMLESNFYVCVGDPFIGFIKYEFTCQEGHYFDPSTSACEPAAATSTESTAGTETTPIITTVVSSTSTSETTPTTIISTKSTPVTETTLTTITTTETTLATKTSPTATTTVATTLETTLPSTTTVATTTTSSPIECALAGIFPFPSNCKMYYRCSTSLKAFYYICPGTSYFNENILKCSMVISAACQEQILKNTTTATMLQTATTPTPTITTTPAPTITTPTSATTTTPAPSITSPSPPGPFSCPSAGTFANPISCKTYFRCSTTGKIYTFTCPGESYYNEFTRRCSLLMTPRCQQLLLI